MDNKEHRTTNNPQQTSNWHDVEIGKHYTDYNGKNCINLNFVFHNG